MALGDIRFTPDGGKRTAGQRARSYGVAGVSALLLLGGCRAAWQTVSTIDLNPRPNTDTSGTTGLELCQKGKREFKKNLPDADARLEVLTTLTRACLILHSIGDAKDTERYMSIAVDGVRPQQDEGRFTSHAGYIVLQRGNCATVTAAADILGTEGSLSGTSNVQRSTMEFRMCFGVHSSGTTSPEALLEIENMSITTTSAATT